MARFPKDKDLAPGDVSACYVLTAEDAGDHSKSARAVEAIRQQMPLACDVILMAVPAGKGTPLVEGLMSSMNSG